MEKITRENATNEVNAWLDYKNVSQRKREENQDSIEDLIDFLVDGTLSINDNTNEITHNLKVPLTGAEGQTLESELVYKARMTVKDLNVHLKGVKANDADGRVMAYICALTGQSRNILNLMDTVDYSIAGSLVVFYI